MIVDADTDDLLGVHIIGEGASELVHIGDEVADGMLDHSARSTRPARWIARTSRG